MEGAYFLYSCEQGHWSREQGLHFPEVRHLRNLMAGDHWGNTRSEHKRENRFLKINLGFKSENEGGLLL